MAERSTLSPNIQRKYSPAKKATVKYKKALGFGTEEANFLGIITII
jgi:hypothetical protein